MLFANSREETAASAEYDKGYWRVDMLTRILTSAIGIVVFFAALFSPARIFMAAILIVTAMMLGEMYGVLKCGMLVNVIGYIAAAIAAVGTVYASGKFMTGALVAIVTIYLVTAVILHGKKSARDILSHGFITVFLTVFMCYVIRLRMTFSVYAALWVFVIAWLTDTGAYFTGVFLGKHKLVPHISPKKTVEGAVGGVVVCVIASAVYAYILNVFAAGEREIVIDVFVSYVLMGLVGSTLSQIGDFAASCIKRDCDVKDYGSILPGHGGLMDRFDSVVFIAPFVYYAMWCINYALAI